LALARLWNQWESRVPIILGLAQLKQRAGEFEEALHLLAELDSLPLENLRFSIEAYAALLRFLSGDQIGSAAWFAAKMESFSLDPTPANESGLLDVARLMILLQRMTDARPLLEKICDRARASGRMYVFIRAKVILSKVFATQGQMTPAQACLLEAIPLAATDGYISTFVDEGETMRQLLHETRGKVASGELRSYVDHLLAAFGSGKNPPAKQEAGYGAPELSEREREILLFVAAGLSNQEVAERLVISITTVKTHVGNIFKKLGVTSRTQAVARAEGMGLLPPR
jgi:LuxR family maltose regulon positive regulatory protein